MSARTLVPARTRGSRAPTAALAALTIALAAGVGLLPVVAGAVAALVTCLVGLAVLGVVFLRRVLPDLVSGVEGNGAQVAAADESSEPPEAQPQSGDLRLSRWLFYLATVSLGEAAFRPALGLTVSEALFMASFASCALAVLRGHDVVVPPSWLFAGVLIFSFGGLISSIEAPSPADSGVEVLQGIYVMLLWVWTGAMVLRTRRHFLMVMALWGVSIAIDGLSALTDLAGLSEVDQSPQGNRLSGFTEHPNDLGGAASIALVPALLIATRSLPGRNAVIRLLSWLPVVLIAAAIVLSGSIAGMAGAAVAISMWIALPFVRAPLRTAVVCVLGAVLLATSFAGERTTTPIQRIEQVTSPVNERPGAGSGRARVSIIKATWPEISSSPVVGKGLDATVTVITDGTPAPYQIHGAPLALWYQAGLFGLVGVLLLFAACVRAGWQSVRSSTNQEDLLIGWALIAALSAFLVYAITAPFVFQQYGWFAFLMIVAWRLRPDAVSVPASPARESLPKPVGARARAYA